METLTLFLFLFYLLIFIIGGWFIMVQKGKLVNVLYSQQELIKKLADRVSALENKQSIIVKYLKKRKNV